MTSLKYFGKLRHYPILGETCKVSRANKKGHEARPDGFPGFVSCVKSFGSGAV